MKIDCFHKVIACVAEKIAQSMIIVQVIVLVLLLSSLCSASQILKRKPRLVSSDIVWVASDFYFYLES